MTTLWDRREALHQSRLTDAIGTRPNGLGQALTSLQQLGADPGGALASVGRTLTGQAYAIASVDIFWLSGWIMLLIIPPLWLARRAVPGGQAVAGE